MAVFSLKFLSVVTGVTVISLMSKRVGVEQFGQYSVFMAFFLLSVSFSQHATSNFIIKNYSFEHGVLSKSWCWIFFVGTMFSGVVALKYEVSYFLCALLYVAASFLLGIRNGLIVVKGVPALGGVLESVVRNVVFSISIVLFLDKSSVFLDVFVLVFFSFFVSFVFFVFFDFLFVRDVVKDGFSILGPSINKKDALSFLSFAMIGGVYAAYASFDIMMVDFISGSEVAGVYKISVLVGSVASFIFTSVALVATPMFRGMATPEVGVYKKLLFSALSVLLIINIFFISVGKEFISLFFSNDYTGAYFPAVVLISAQVITVILGFSDTALMVKGYERKVLMIGSVSLMLNVILNYIFIPEFGINGAALATFLSTFFWKVSTFVFAKKLIGKSFSVFSR